MIENRDFFSSEKDYRSQIVSIIQGDLSDNELREKLSEYHEKDIADSFELLTEDDRKRLFRILDREFMSDIVTFLDDAGNYLSETTVDNAAGIIGEMDADDALETLDELDDTTRNEIFDLISDPETKEDIQLIDSYDDREFGSRMSTNFIAVKRDQTIKETMKALISMAADNDNIYTIFVVDKDDSFYGVIDLKDLIVARSNVELETLISNTFPFVYDKDIISENIEHLREYSENMIPVISRENHTLLGVITSTDIVELIDEERSDDYAKLAALSSESEENESLFASMKKRVPWLIALLFMGLAVSAVVRLFEGVVDALPIIVSFQSLILGMAGNVGTQSLAVTIRRLGDDDDNSFKNHLIIILKEVRVAMINGLVLGAISFVIVSIYLIFLTSNTVAFTLTAAICVGLAMFFSMTISGLTGTLIPITLYRMGIDPAVASGPLITTVNDLVAVISYYGLAWALLLNI